jgi:hypothetical protein
MIGTCSFCPDRWLAYEFGLDARGRRTFMCFECLEAARVKSKKKGKLQCLPPVRPQALQA